MTSRRLSDSRPPREVRRRVVLPARLRTGVQWSDTCILNISSRGLMIHSGKPAPKGSLVELRRGEHVIIARIAWRDGARVGLCAEDRVPIEEIMSVGQSQAFRLTASDGVLWNAASSLGQRHSTRGFAGALWNFLPQAQSPHHLPGAPGPRPSRPLRDPSQRYPPRLVVSPERQC